MTIQFLRKDGSTVLSTQVLPPQPVAVRGVPGTASATISGRVLIRGAAAIQVDALGHGLNPKTYYLPIRSDGTFVLTQRRGRPTGLYVVDRHNRQLSNSLPLVPETYWRSLIAQAQGRSVLSASRIRTANRARLGGGAGSLYAKTRRVNWTDVQTITGGRVVYHTTKITTVADTYTIALSVTNRSEGAVELRTYPPKQPIGYVSPESFGVAYRGPTAHRPFVNTRATTFSPVLPKSLQPGESWQGTFSGRTRELLKHHDWWIFFGMVVPGGHWVSDKTFST
jgi:hypothetical protein